MRPLKISRILFLITIPSLLWSGSYNPSLHWKTLETNHFLIHYPSRLRGIALKMGWIAEDVYQKLVPFMRWTPAEKTHIVIIDDTDIANGYTTFTPHNRIEIFLTPPPLESSLQNYDDWLYMVFTHEFTHVLHIDQHGGIATISRELFGRNFIAPLILFPSLPVALFPSWIHESIAVYNETRFTSGGRGRSTFADMVVYTALLERNFPTLAQLLTPPPQWPAGYIPYIFGEKFLSYLIKKHGINSLYRSFIMERNFFFPFWEELLHLAAFHTLAEEDYFNWQRYLLRIAHKKHWKLRRKNITPLTPPMWEHTAPICYRGKIIYLEHTGYSKTSIALLNPSTNSVKKLVEGYILPYMSVNERAGMIVYSKLEYYKRYNIFSDLYLFDLKENSEKRLTIGQRLRYPVFSGNIIYALKITYESVKIVKMETNGKIIETIPVPGVDNAAFLTINQKGDLVFSAHKGNSINIIQYNPQNNLFTFLTKGDYIDLYPYPFKNEIIFSSNRDGNGFNLYLIKGDKITRITPGFGGYFKAAICNNTIYSDLYTSKGYRVVKLPEKWFKKTVNFTTFKSKKLAPVKTTKLPPSFPQHSYNPFKNLLPTTAYPSATYQPQWGWKIGISIESNDVLNFIGYYLNLDDLISLRKLDYNGWLIVRKFNPDFAIGGGKFTVIEGKKFKSLNFFTFQISSDFPSINSFDKNFVMTYNYASNFTPPITSKGSLRLSFLFNSAHYYPEIWRPNDGSSAGISFILYAPFLGTPYITWGIVAEGKNYLPVGKSAILINKIYSGITGGDGFSNLKILAEDSSNYSSIFYFQVPSEDSFNFAGYITDGVITDKILAMSSTLNFRIFRINNGIGTIPVWFGEIWDELYTQHILFHSNKTISYKGNVGNAIVMNLNIGYQLPIYLKLALTYKIPSSELTGGIYFSLSPF